jgi:hypothetical protein
MIGALPVMENVGQWVVGVLAVLGGAALGGLGVGLLAQFCARTLTLKPLPPIALRVLRLLGAVVVGWAVFLLVFGTGHFGFGRGGGLGFGGGPEGNPSTGSTQKAGGNGNSREPAPSDDALRIEVLGDPRVAKDHFYRVEGDAELHTLVEVRKRIDARRKQDPSLRRLNIVVYKNSPDPLKAQVTDLKALAHDFELGVAVYEPDREAP